MLSHKSSDEDETPLQNKKTNSNLQPVILLLVLQLVLQAVLIWRISSTEITLNQFLSQGSLLTSTASSTDTDIQVSIPEGNHPPLGNPSAPVTVVEFASFNCVYCKQSVETLQALIEQRPNEVRIFYRHAVPETDEGAIQAAIALECAEETQYWPLHDALFEASPFSANDARIQTIASEFGIDASSLNTCMNNDELRERINDDRDLALEIGVPGTPTFVVNGRRLIGTRTLEQFLELVDSFTA